MNQNGRRCVFQVLRLHITLYGEYLGHAVGDWCAGGEDDAAAVVHGLNATNFQTHIEGTFTRRLGQSDDAGHF